MASVWAWTTTKCVGGGWVEAASGTYCESDNLCRAGQHPPEGPHPFVMGYGWV